MKDIDLYHIGIEELDTDFVSWDDLKNRTIFITGATGLIGSTLVKTLDRINKTRNLNMSVVALVRDKEKASERFCDVLPNGMLRLFEGNVNNPINFEEDVDYIVHGASKTASKDFIDTPVETVETTVCGTMNMLRLAKDKQVKSFVYLSSMEVYGCQAKGHKISENEIGNFLPTDLRNSYPISKIAAESLCCSYAKEYGVSTSICRLAQTIGTEYSEKDNRVFAYMDKAIKAKQNIVLKTRGESERCYISALDAVMAIIVIMTRGESGEIYNAADEKTYGSIASMAETMASRGGVKVEYCIQDNGQNGFPQTTYLNLDTSSLKKLGWRILER